MSNVVEYILKLKSGEFDSGIDRAERKAEGLNARMGSLARSVAGFVSAFAVGNYLNNAVTAWNESEQALGQLQATMKSTGGAVGVTTDAMVAQAKALQSLTTYDDDAIVGMQSVLATFTNIKQEIFTGAVPAILDLSTKMGQDLKSSAVQVGKALNDPIQGITALRRVGVNFSDEQEKVIKNLVETNRVAEAQSMILRELQVEFGGSAEAAALVGTGPMQQLRNEMGDVNEEVGALVAAVGKELLPTFRSLVAGLRETVKWISENTGQVMALATAAGTLVIGMRVVIPLMAELGVATSAMLGPLAAVTAAVYLLTDSYNTMMETEKAWQNAREGFDKRQLANQREALKQDAQLYKKRGFNDAQAFAKATESEYNALVALKGSLNEKFSKAMDVGEQNQLIEQLKQTDVKLKGLEQIRSEGVNALAAPKTTPQAGAALPPTGKTRPARDPMRTQATGSKAVTINVTIGDLIKQFTIHTTNMKEGAMKAKEQVAAALMGAVNDFQIVAEK